MHEMEQLNFFIMQQCICYKFNYSFLSFLWYTMNTMPVVPDFFRKTQANIDNRMVLAIVVFFY